MKAFASLLVFLLGACSAPTNDSSDCTWPSASYTVNLARTSGNCGPIPSFGAHTSHLSTCEGTEQWNGCTYTLVDECGATTEILFLDFTDSENIVGTLNVSGACEGGYDVWFE